MSISTGSLSSYHSSLPSDGSDMSTFTPRTKKSTNDPTTHHDTKQKGQEAGWHSEVYRKIHTYKADMKTYLHDFVPSNTPCTLDLPDVSIAATWAPEKGKERMSYEPLKILTHLVSEFPADRRPSFCIGGEQLLHFPFSECASKHQDAKPDLLVSLPGQDLPVKVEAPQFRQFSMFIEAKDLPGKDPFTERAGRRESTDRSKRLVQLAIGARGLMFAHGHLAAFMLGIYGDIVRIARFDHACGVASPPINLHTQEGLRSVQEFFWRFVHPWEGGPGLVVGCDPTVRALTPEDCAWLREQLGHEADELLEGVDLSEARWMKVYDEDDPAKVLAYISFKCIELNARLFSRSTMIWLSILDTRFCQLPWGGNEVEVHVIKESWRQAIRTPEQAFYKRLKETVPEEERVDLPNLLYGGDLGRRDEARQEAALKRKVWPGGDALAQDTAAARPPATDSSFTRNEASSIPPFFSVKPIGTQSSESSLTELTQSDMSGDNKPKPVPVPPPASGAASTSGVRPRLSSRPSGSQWSESSLSELTDSGMSDVDADELGPEDTELPQGCSIPRPMHKTYSWRLCCGEKYEVNERSHMRFVIDTVGRPLSRFQRTKDLAMAIRDALEGHRLAWEYGGVLHKDVSSGNILIVVRRRPGRKPSRGIIHDFDYSAMLAKAPQVESTMGAGPSSEPHFVFRRPENVGGYAEVANFKERTGTYYFMAMDLLHPQSEGMLHEPRHDLESFIWVLLWIVLRHTQHKHWQGARACEKVFKYGDDYEAHLAKKGWANDDQPIIIEGNGPLTDLLRQLQELLHEANNFYVKKRVPLTHKALIDAFDEVIARDDWPEDDRAIPYVPPKTDHPTAPKGVLLPSPGKNKKRTRQDDHDEEEAIEEENGSLESGVSESATTKRRRNSRVQTASRASKAAGPSTRGSGRRGGRSQPKKAASGKGPASGGTRGSGKKKGV
ncbi:hypothetical protein BD413DRAFT_616947 [Trametes elegans]|nr:hypothetical protein BD413DRAFT_616947 [Trametes elegans]